MSSFRHRHEEESETLSGKGLPAVILMAYGSPNSLDEVGEYLSQVRGGRIASQDEVEHLRERYRRVGGRTPLLQITISQAKALEESLHSQSVPARVHFGMKHWHPLVEDVVEKIVSENPPVIIGVALAPHYSKLSIGGYEEGVRRGLAKAKSDIPFIMVESWHTESSLVRALSYRVSSEVQKMNDPEGTILLFTAHSLPKKAVSEEDPYEAQLRETSRLVASQANVKNWDFAFQSAGGPANAWIGPTIKEKIVELARRGFRQILVCPVGFVSDHLEILYDLDVEAKEYALYQGLSLQRTASLNDDPMFIEALASVVRPLLSLQPIATPSVGSS